MEKSLSAKNSMISQKIKKILRYSRYTSRGWVFNERFFTVFKDLPKHSVKRNANLIYETISVCEEDTYRKQASTKLTPAQASLKTNEE